MGASFVANLQKAGHKLTVHDVRRAAAEPHVKAGAAWANSPRDAGGTVRGHLHLAARAARGRGGGARPLNGLLAGMKDGSGLFRSSTNSRPWCANPRGSPKNHVYMLDAPVSGGPVGAATGKLALSSAATKTSSTGTSLRSTDRRPGPLHRPDRRRLWVAKLVHNWRLCDPVRPRRSVHDGREGRRRAARAVVGGAPRCRGRRRTFDASPTNSCPTNTIRPISAAARAQGGDPGDNWCRCGVPMLHRRSSRAPK